MDIAILALEDGTVFTGTAFGARGESDGEVVFNTSMTGYQEILTDPSYHGQIVAMTNPQIGNYGINDEDAESRRPWVRGFVIRELSGRASNHRSTGSLSDYLEQHGVIGIEGIDTRALVRLTREHGAMKGILSTTDLDEPSLVAKARASLGLVGRDLTREVMPSKSTSWQIGLDHTYLLNLTGAPPTQKSDAAIESSAGARAPHVVALDFGMKWNILRHLVEIGCKVTVMPGFSPAQAILEVQPDGIFLSNGPGDPRPLTEATDMLRALIRDAAEARGIPIFGICLGHQLLG
ncbi:MAG: glutamine-hydrolyzing carbamoyl-phosphate synthase small subunit, partial [Isosphaerales bacterium]